MNGQVQTRQGSIGFTIIEVIVAFTLFSITTLMLVSVTGAVQYSQRQSIYINIAKQVAQSKIAEYQNLGYEAHSIGHVEDFSNSATLSDLPAGKTATIKVSQPSLAENSKELEVAISYSVASSPKTVTMKAYVTKEGLASGEPSEPVPEATSLSCFLIDSGGTRVRDYYSHENNVSSNPVCPRNVVIPPMITSVYSSSMASKSLASVVFLDAGQTISIGSNAFQNNNIASLNIPASVDSVSTSAFVNSGIATLTFSERMTPLSIGSNAFQSNNITSLITPPQVTSIGSFAFANNNSLMSAQVAGSTSISSNAFPASTTIVRY